MRDMMRQQMLMESLPKTTTTSTASNDERFHLPVPPQLEQEGGEGYLRYRIEGSGISGVYYIPSFLSPRTESLLLQCV